MKRLALVLLLALALPGCNFAVESKPPCKNHHYEKLHTVGQPAEYGKC